MLGCLFTYLNYLFLLNKIILIKNKEPYNYLPLDIRFRQIGFGSDVAKGSPIITF